jgi:hypothetical protein
MLGCTDAGQFDFSRYRSLCSLLATAPGQSDRQAVQRMPYGGALL